MTTVLLVLICLLAAAVFVQFGALVEMFNQLQQIRRHLGMFDLPRPIDLGAVQGLCPSELGLPAELDSADHAVVLFLSDRCQTCFTLAQALAGAPLPPSLWLVLVPIGDPDEFLREYQLSGERILIDPEERLFGQLGLDVTPAAIVVRAGRVDEAQTVPTARQLFAALSPASETAITLTLRNETWSGR